MRRGTTPTHRFNTPIDFTNAETLYLTYKQGNKTVVEKSIDDVEITADELKVTLTQTETLGFNARLDVEIQCRARFPDNKAVASNIIRCEASRILKEGVI